VKPARLFTVFLLLLACLGACGRPEPPTITPEKGEVSSVGPDGIHLVLHLGVKNPNRYDLSARSVTGRVKLAGQYDLGSVTVTQPFQLAAGKTTPMAVPMTVALRDVPRVLALAATNPTLPYEVEGQVTIGGEKINVDLPFRLSGIVTQEQLLKATANSLPRFP
jgi:LEA14-like dessication related protein